jgi:hypothetical protein
MDTPFSGDNNARGAERRKLQGQRGGNSEQLTNGAGIMLNQTDSLTEDASQKGTHYSESFWGQPYDTFYHEHVYQDFKNLLFSWRGES